MRERSDGSDFDIFFRTIAQRHDARGRPTDDRFGDREIAAHGLVANLHFDAEPLGRDARRKVVVEFLGDVAGQLQMLLLVLADRHMRGAVEQNVGSHQARIGKQAERGVLTVLAGLVLELGHAVHPADAGDAIEYPGKLGMLHDARLVEHDVLLRIDAGGKERRRDLARLVLQIVMHELGCQRMQVDDAINAVRLVLQRDEFFDRAEIVAEMEIAGGLNTGKDELLEAGHFILVACGGPYSMVPEKLQTFRRRPCGLESARRKPFRARALWTNAWPYSRGGSAAPPALGAPRRLTLRRIIPTSAPPMPKAAAK
jgi:hypothetical protein